jgi:hypothetical protein
MNLILPQAPNQYSGAFFNNLFQVLRNALGGAVNKDSETPRVILRSPSGKNFDLTVSDSGVLVVTPTERTVG